MDTNLNAETAIEKPDYKNWMPATLVKGMRAASTVLWVIAAVVIVQFAKIPRPYSIPAAAVTVVFAAGCTVFAVKFKRMYDAFSYDGKRQLSREIIEGVASYVTLPDGGLGLDVGCGSGALTIACARNNPNASMLGIDRWGKDYASFSLPLCRRNARAEGITNVRFQKGNAVSLDFPDETFDAVTSNYVYHNITGKNKQDLLLETLRVLKKGGTFAIHDLMSPSRYGDMDAFESHLKAMGFSEVRRIDTADSLFMTRQEARAYGLAGTTLLVGRK